jgi:hypothetical protein
LLPVARRPIPLKDKSSVMERNRPCANKLGSVRGCSRPSGPSRVRTANSKRHGAEKVLYAFQDASDGAMPTGGLRADKKGNLYGTASTAGNDADCNSGCGTVFELER